jgi:hypothetical protein
VREQRADGNSQWLADRDSPAWRHSYKGYAVWGGKVHYWDGS